MDGLLLTSRRHRREQVSNTVIEFHQAGHEPGPEPELCYFPAPKPVSNYLINISDVGRYHLL